jgi:hypothetical protein
MGYITPPLRTGPDIAADTQTAPLILFPSLGTKVRPPPISSQRNFLQNSRLTRLVLPVIVFEAFISIVDPCCKDNAL